MGHIMNQARFENSKREFLKTHLIRGIVIGILSFSFFYFILIPFILSLESVKDFYLLPILESLNKFEQRILLLVVAFIIFLCFPVIAKLINSLKYFSGLHGFIVGCSLAFIFRITTITQIAISDISCVVMYSIILLPIAFSIYYHRFKNKRVKTTDTKSNVTDELNYKNLIDQMSEYFFPIENNSKPDAGMTEEKHENKIAVLYGANGLGKSHCLKLLEAKLFEEGKKNVTVEYFYPSRYSADIMTKEFYTQLERIFTKYYYLPNFSFYSQTFANLVNITEQNMGFTGFFNTLFTNLLFGERKDISELLSYYKEETENVILFIDESDRCTDKQIHALIDLLRNLGTQIHFKILITFTHEMEAKIKETRNPNGRETIFEKFAKKIFTLTEKTQKVTRKYWLKITEDEDKDMQDLVNYFPPFINEVLSTPRLMQLFKNHSCEFAKNYKRLINIQDESLAIAIFILAVKTCSPNAYKKLSSIYHAIRYLKHKELDEDSNKQTQGVEQKDKKEHSIKSIAKELLSADATPFAVFTSYISDCVKYFNDLEKSYWLEYVFKNIIPYTELAIDNNTEANKYLDSIQRLIKEEPSHSNNSFNIALFIADEISVKYEICRLEIEEILKGILYSFDRKTFFSEIFGKIHTVELQKQIYCFTEEVIEDKTLLYNSLWENWQGSYHFDKYNNFFKELTKKNYYTILSSYYNQANWEVLKEVINYLLREVDLPDIPIEDVIGDESNDNQKNALKYLVIYLKRYDQLIFSQSEESMNSNFKEFIQNLDNSLQEYDWSYFYIKEYAQEATKQTLYHSKSKDLELYLDKLFQMWSPNSILLTYLILEVVKYVLSNLRNHQKSDTERKEFLSTAFLYFQKIDKEEFNNQSFKEASKFYSLYEECERLFKNYGFS